MPVAAPGSRLSRFLRLLSVALLAVSVPVAVVEAGPFLAMAFGPPAADASYSLRIADRLSSLVPESRLARRRRLESCLAAKAATSNADARRTFAAQCRSVAEMSAAKRPLSGNDWLIAASLARELGDSDAARRFLSASFRSTPGEGWIAERRLPLAVLVRGELPADLSAAMDGDARLLFSTASGAWELARLYARRADTRDYLTGIGETLDSEAKQRFLGQVREAVRQ